MSKILILEPGAWGTALGILLSKKNKVCFWYEKPELSFKIDKFRTNERLPNIKIPQRIFVSCDLEKLIKGTDLIIVASPSFGLRDTLKKLRRFKGLPPLLGIAKGIEKETLKVPSQIVEEVLGRIPYVHLSGPGFAKEIANGKEAKEVIASKNKALLKFAEGILKIKPLEIHTTTDLVGLQLAGAFKNALSIGISLVESKCGNPEILKTKDSLIEYGLEEMVRLGRAMGSKKETFFGPAGLEDLILTSSNTLSRNYQFGQALLLDADKLRKAIKERKITVEGFDNAFALQKLGQIHKLNLPMVEEIYKVIYKRVSPIKVIDNLIRLVKVI